MEIRAIYALIIWQSYHVSTTSASEYLRYYSSSSNCIGSYSEDGSDVEFFPCPNTTMPSFFPSLVPTISVSPPPSTKKRSSDAHKKNDHTRPSEFPPTADMIPSAISIIFPTFAPPSGERNGKVLTALPTSKPTPRQSSSFSPTQTPTLFTFPSLRPIQIFQKPSGIPSLRPIKEHTTNPSYLFPSFRPTQVSGKPNNKPSTNPSFMYPSTHPTYSKHHTEKPSGKPSLVPIKEHTTNPSYQFPSFHPSQVSGKPNNKPSTKPSKKHYPSIRPTELSGKPSNKSSTRPTNKATSSPSFTFPSIRPTQISGKASNKISARPTNKPTSSSSFIFPSIHPTQISAGKPSKKPSARPTNKPTSSPSFIFPSIHPTQTIHPTQISGKLRNKPSARPTNKPTSSPSFIFPSIHPAQTYGKPSNKPSARPTNKPTSSPSLIFPFIHPTQISGELNKTLLSKPSIIVDVAAAVFTSMDIVSDHVEKKYSCLTSEGIGSRKLTKVPLKFTYLVETSSNSTDFLSDLESAMLRTLSMSTLQCESLVLASSRGESRLLEEHKSSGFASISSFPIDKISDSETCEVENSNSVSCYVVDGGFSLEVTSSDELVINLQKIVILKALVKSMASGEFLSNEIPELLYLRYLGPDVVDVLRDGVAVNNFENDDLSSLDFAYIALGSTLFIAIFAYFTRRRFLPRDEDWNGSSGVVSVGSSGAESA